MRGIAIGVAVLVGACATETGIILVIDSNSELPQPTEIVVMLGQAAVDLDGVALETFVDSNSDRFTVDPERDLSSDPFRYLIRPGAAESFKVAVAGLGPEVGEPLTAFYGDTLEFAPDVVLEIKLTLDHQGGTFDDCSRCFVAGDATFQITSEIDADCDGFLSSDVACEDKRFGPLDCDDRDSGRHPELLEICDGLDDDCDSLSENYSIACFAGDLDTCLLGTSTCSEGEGFSACVAEGDPLAIPVELCGGLATCQGAADPVQCYADQLREGNRLQEKTCEIAIAANGADARLCTAGTLVSFDPGCAEVLVAAIEGPPGAREAVTVPPENNTVTPGTRILCNQETTQLDLGGARALDRAARLFAIEVLEVEGVVGHLVNLRPRFVEACSPGDEVLECF